MADLVSLSDVKSFLGISGSSNDAVLSTIISSVSTFVENYIGYTVASTTYTNEEFDGTGKEKYNIPVYPVTVFTSMDYRTTSANENSWEQIDSEDYFVYLDEGYVHLIGGFHEGPKNYRMTYTAGYESTPADLELAVLQMIRDVYNTKATSSTVTQERLKDYAVSYGAIASMISEQNRATLDIYRNIAL